MAITFIDKGIGLQKVIRDAGYYLRQHNGVWQSSNDDIVQTIINDYPLSSTQAEVIGLIDEHAKKLRDSIVSSISPAEMASWFIKSSEATAYNLSKLETDAPMLVLEAQQRGIGVDVLVNKVLQKANYLSYLEAAIAGTAGKHSDAVKLLTTFEAVLSYDWHTGWPI